MIDNKNSIFWAKRQEDSACIHWHPLVHHCLEVASVLHALMETGVMRKRLARAVARDDFTPQQVVRLAVLAAWHDAGKCNLGFQEQYDEIIPPWQTHGHVREIFKLIFDSPSGQEGCQAMELAAMEKWLQNPDDLIYWLWSVFCHHGRPLAGDPFFQGMPSRSELKKISSKVWLKNSRRDPLAGLLELSKAMRQVFPDAFRAVPDPLPLTPPLQHLFNGLLTLADWIGSDADRFFPYAESQEIPAADLLRQKSRLALQHLGYDTTDARTNLKQKPIIFSDLFGYATPNPIQQKMAGLDPDPNGNIVILEAETGAGKTEAALLYFLKLFQEGLVDGLYFALPTRAAAVQIHARVQQAVATALGPDHPPVVLAVPGYLQVDEVRGVRLPSSATLWSDDQDRYRYRGWAAEHPKRYFAAAIAVGTVDQVLLSALSVPHAHMRAAALSRLLLVVDEVHASDAYMTTILQEVITRQVAVGGHVLLMSATLGSAIRTRFLHGPRAELPPPEVAAATPYPLITTQRSTQNQWPVPGEGLGKVVHISPLNLADDTEIVAAMALTAARAGARVLVIRNTVHWVIETQMQLEAQAGSESNLLMQCMHKPAPHHARFAAGDRKLLDAAVTKGLGKQANRNGGLVVISSQTTEQSLDIDADYLITDLCPMDVLLQRIGRLHRHPRTQRPEGYAHPRLVLLLPENELDGYLEANGQVAQSAMGHGWGSIYDDMRVLAATWETLAATPSITIPADNRRLVEAVTHPDNLAQLAEKRGKIWQQHGEGLFGKKAAQKNLARAGLYDRGKWLHECGFTELTDVRLTTRLGLQDRQVQFDPVPMGPFGIPVPMLTIPGRWLGDQKLSDAACPEAVLADDGIIEFMLGERRFRYDRLGLRPVV
ncbi:MAG: CRISPR-associated helicase Cas3' [Magnetococcales bacterium]|nr:CRISPR-associated helicase Cas3' [Magnetococcales bacterium]